MNDHTVVYFDTPGDGRSDMLIAANGLKALTAVEATSTVSPTEDSAGKLGDLLS